MKKRILVIGLIVVLLFSTLIILNYTVIKARQSEQPKITLLETDYPNIINKKTTYRNETIIEPITRNEAINELINKDYSTISNNHKSIDYTILTNNDSLLSIEVNAGNKRIPLTYIYDLEKAVDLDSIFLEQAHHKNILNLALDKQQDYHSYVGVKDNNIIIALKDEEIIPVELKDIAGFIDLEIAEYINIDLANREFKRRESQALAKKTEERIKVQLSRTKDSVNCLVEKCVALTFDDGPTRQTKKLLEILKDKEVLATFYTLGQQINKYPEITKQIVDEGHSLGNHTYSHPNLQDISEDSAFSEILKTQDLIYELTEYYPLTYRPPYGVSRDLSELYPQDEILWNIDTKDWEHRDTKTIVEKATQDVTSGSIILMHDTYESTVNAVPAIIDNLKNQDFVFVTIEDLLINNKEYTPESRTINSLSIDE